MVKEAEVAKENLAQDVVEESENDSAETSHLTIQEESEIDPDYKADGSHVLL